MNINDWVMTKHNVGVLHQIGEMWCQIHVFDGNGLKYPLLVETNDIYVIPKEVADIMRSV